MTRGQKTKLRRKKEYFERKKIFGNKDPLNVTTNEAIYTYTGKYDGCYGMGKKK